MFQGTDDHSKSDLVEASDLKKIDPAFKKVHVTATSQVAVYSYNSAEETWEQTDTVGQLHLYERNDSPLSFGLIVMNRENENNFLQTFGSSAQFVMEQPYILIQALKDLNSDPRDGSHAIYCIWFYEPKDCISSANVLRDFGLKFEGEEETFDKVGEHKCHLEGDSPSSMGNHAGNHLFQILRRAKGLPKEKEDVCHATELKSILKTFLAQDNQVTSESKSVEKLKRIDATFHKLQVTATGPVAVFKYNSAAEKWDKTDIIGSLFFYERNASPQYGLVVMNRKKENNFLQVFGPAAQFVMKRPNILIRAVEDLHSDSRDETHPIYCIWFYESNDCIASANVLRDMGLKFEGEANTFDNVGDHSRCHLTCDSPSRLGSHKGNHLFQMLRKTKGLPVNREDICNKMIAGRRESVDLSKE